MERITEAIVLAGGLGTRLRAHVPDVPKSLAPIAGKPFLAYLLRYLEQEGITHIILALGYRAEAIRSWLERASLSAQLSLSIESEPLGTGGAIAHAWPHTHRATVAVLNGDTFFPLSLEVFGAFHAAAGVPVSLALAEVAPADRYGTVEVEGGQVRAFREKEPRPRGWIYGGIALIESTWWQAQNWSEKFSWEAYLTRQAGHLPMGAYCAKGVPFIDIGIPADYERAQTLIPAHAAL